MDPQVQFCTVNGRMGIKTVLLANDLLAIYFVGNVVCSTRPVFVVEFIPECQVFLMDTETATTAIRASVDLLSQYQSSRQ
jgi:hypothetical protein